MSYTRRFIDVYFSGGQGGDVSFTARGKYALRTSARILKAGGFNFGSLSLELRGLSLHHINQLSTFGRRIHPNYGYSVRVDAGDDINGMSTVFDGQIDQAWGDMKAMPDVPFHVVASAGGSAATMKATPTSFQGPTEVKTMLQQLAGKAKLGFQSYGVDQKLADPYHWGSPWKQMKEIIDAAGINGFIDNKTLYAWGQNSAVDGNLFISPQTGLRDYPAFTEYGVQVITEFRRAITYGSTMTIQSDITPACGDWNIIRIDYDLQANTPKGSWYAVLDGAKFGSPVTGL